MIYPLLKLLHISCVTLSGAGFFLRGVWMLRDSPLLQRRWVHTAPHLVDSLLLASGVGMAVISAQYPFVFDWLTAKLIGLLIYILCGVMALKRGKTRRQRALFFLFALAAFFYIVSVALTRHPLGVLDWLA